MNLKTAKLFLQVVALSLLLSGLARAQTGAGILSGKVTSPSGTAAANARVSVKNLATGQTAEAQTDAAGVYTVASLPPGDYEVSVSAQALAAKAARVTVAAGAKVTVDLTLGAAAGVPAPPSLGDLGFTPEAAQGSTEAQARLDRRSHMLKTHQRLGLITLAPLIATLAPA